MKFANLFGLNPRPRRRQRQVQQPVQNEDHSFIKISLTDKGPYIDVAWANKPGSIEELGNLLHQLCSGNMSPLIYATLKKNGEHDEQLIDLLQCWQESYYADGPLIRPSQVLKSTYRGENT